MTKLKHWQDPVSVLVGVWLIVSPWVLGFQGESYAMGNAVLVGIALGAIAVGTILVPRAWEEWTESGLGVWLIASPWVLDFQHLSEARTNALAAGIAVLVLALWVLVEDKDYRRWLDEGVAH